MVLAVSGQQALGIGVAVALVVGWLIYVIVVAKRGEHKPGAELELAPNRKPYLDDDALEGPKLDRALTWGLLSLAFIAVALPVYWLREPGRQVGAVRDFDERSVGRGAELFQSASAKLPPGHIAAGCADCHGNKGQGGVVSFTLQDPNNKDKIIPVSWQAPALNTVMLRFSEDQVRQILVYGRPPTPMPAWGVSGGGALGDQQIGDLIAFLKSIQIKPDQARNDANQTSSRTKSAAEIGNNGQQLFNEYCARCHTLGWSYRDSYQEPNAQPGGGAYGPNLRGGETQRQFPDPSQHVAFITEGSVFGKNYGRRGVGTGRMPGFGQLLTQEQIKAIVDYERSL